MRLLGFMLFAFGLVLMLAPSTLTSLVIDREIARAMVYDNGEFLPFEAELGPSQAPLGIVIRAQEGGAYQAGGGTAALTLVVSQAGASVFAGAVAFEVSDVGAPDDGSGAGGATVYEKRIAHIAGLSGGSYSFVASQGDADAIDLQRVEIILRANAFAVRDFSSAAIAMVWIGAILWFIGQRRRSRRLPQSPPKPELPKPGPNKWGRQ